MKFWQRKLNPSGRLRMQEVTLDDIDHTKPTIYILPGYNTTNNTPEEFLKAGISERVANTDVKVKIKIHDRRVKRALGQNKFSDTDPQVITISYNDLSDIRNIHLQGHIENKNYISDEAKDFVKNILLHPQAEWNNITLFGVSYGSLFGEQIFSELNENVIPFSKRNQNIAFITLGHLSSGSVTDRYVTGLYIIAKEDQVVAKQADPHTNIRKYLPENHHVIELTPSSKNELVAFTSITRDFVGKTGKNYHDPQRHQPQLYLMDDNSEEGINRVALFQRALNNAVSRTKSLSPIELLAPKNSTENLLLDERLSALSKSISLHPRN